MVLTNLSLKLMTQKIWIPTSSENYQSELSTQSLYYQMHHCG